MRDLRSSKFLPLLALMAITIIAGCGRGHEGAADTNKLLRCYPHGVAPGNFCRASMLQVVTARGLFEGRQVIVPGFAGDVEGDLYLFPNQEFYRSRDVSSSVRLLGSTKLLKDKINSNVIVFGAFTLEAPEPSTLMKPVGAISVIHARNGFNRIDAVP
ncbi:hypothetical protein H4W19_01665 [Pseudoxanthomonas mexicana]|uniref:Uncharacterized protein n=1 Tax=Pseudoxanthomonas mexicana TaxID=128785 RepID=A0ABX6RCH5_PSEMX|nr:hypothetical protein [Pseudoxanthomonas mexicana]QND80541.1 hypothetical protein H4W19_01665 [Pseudoxanthomonas mexicana]